MAILTSVCGLLVFSLGACSDDSEPPASTAESDAELAIGRPTVAPEIRAVGLVGYATDPNPGYYPWPFTPVGVATLIGERTLLVSLDWTWNFQETYFGGPLLFSYGDNPLAAKRTIPIVDADLAPPNGSWTDFEGYFAGMGGIGVYYLRRTAKSLTPVDVAAVRKDQIGKSFHVPWSDWPEEGGPRISVGQVRLLATSGPGYPAMFDRFNVFAKWYESTLGASGQYPLDPTEFRHLKRIYAGTDLAYGNRSSRLDTHNEVLVKGLPGPGSVHRIGYWGDAGVGAPLMRKDASGKWEVYGLYNYEFTGSNESPNRAQVALDFKAFGPETLAFLKAAQSRTDPCAKVVGGDHCDGYKLRTCGSDHRTERTMNCRWEVGNFAGTCVTSSSGNAACGMPNTP